MLIAAFLALEEAGCIAFEITGKGKDEQVVAVPAGKPCPFAEKTIEARLNIPTPQTVAAIVYEWLDVDSEEPAARGVEQGYVMLTIKGLATVTKLGGGTYELSEEGRSTTESRVADVRAVKNMLDTCRQQRPQLWKLLARDIATASAKRTYKKKNKDDAYEAPTPWNDESQKDRDSVKTVASKTGMPLFIKIMIAAGAIPGVWILLTDDAGKEMRMRLLVMCLFFIPLVFAIVGAFLKSMAKDAINKKVLGKPEVDNHTEGTTAASAGAGTSAAQYPQTNWQHPVTINVIRANELPPVSDDSKRRIDAITQREPALHKLTGIMILVMSSLLMALVAGYMYVTHGAPSGAWFTPMSSTLFVFYIITIIFVARGNKIQIRSGVTIMLQAARRALASHLPANERKVTLLPVWRILMFWIWVFIILVATSHSFSELHNNTTRKIFVAAAMLLVTGSYAIYKWQRSILEKKYPFYGPVNLLALRVFGSPYLTDFLRLTGSWQWLGTTQRLDGPDTTGEKWSDVLNYLTGRIDRSIVEDQNELSQEIKKIKSDPDKYLRFPLNSMQCMNETWKDALQYLLNRADVVVMDFSFLSPRNLGVAFETGKLFDQFGKERVLFLINDSTDMGVLEEIMNRAWNNRSAHSPNAHGTDATINCIHTGVMPLRKDNESYYDWKRRFVKPVDGDHLVAMLFDKSQPVRNPVRPPDKKAHRYAIHWTKLRIPHILERSLKVVLFIYIFFKLKSLI